MQKSQIVRIVIAIIAAVGVYMLAGRIIDQILPESPRPARKTATRERQKAANNEPEFSEDFENISEKIASDFPPGNGKTSEAPGSKTTEKAEKT